MIMLFYLFKNVNAKVLGAIIVTQKFLAILYRLGRIIHLEEKVQV